VAKRAAAGGSESLRGRYLDLARKYADLVERNAMRSPVVAAGESTPARIASVGIALLDVRGRFVQRSARWKLFASPRLEATLAAAVRKTARAGPSVQQLRVTGRRGVKLVIRLEAIDELMLALASEEAVTWSADDERSQTRLRHGERLRALGQLAAAVAHDLSSTLRSIRYLLSSIEADEVVRERCGEALTAMARGLDDSSTVVGQLHDFARNSGAQSLQLVKLPEVIQAAVTLFQLESSAQAEEVQVTVSVGEMPSQRASPGEMTHVLFNLLRNARDASGGKGRISIFSGVTGDVVRISVADRGEGIRPSDFPHLFEPFFTTKGDKGTGLGLFICAGLVERMGGSIRASNRAGGGAVFTVELPAYGVPAPHEAVVAPERAKVTRGRPGSAVRIRRKSRVT
jgi:signal transduction histidine kinase